MMFRPPTGRPWDQPRRSPKAPQRALRDTKKDSGSARNSSKTAPGWLQEVSKKLPERNTCEGLYC